ncbi:MAG: nitroreductase family protein [[Clostridium] scindens]
MNFESLQGCEEGELQDLLVTKGFSRETLTHLVDVARMSPSGCNSQPWHFIIVDEPKAHAKVVEALDDHGLTLAVRGGAKVPALYLDL